MSVSRRAFLDTASSVPFLVTRSLPAAAPDVHARFPAHDDQSVKDVVAASHGNLARVKEMVTARPALARASWDWGFGDWETPIDAASHVGNRPIAEFLIASGARPTIFTAVMTGQIAIVKALFEATPGLQRMRGPHGLTMMAHARAGGEGNTGMVKYLEALGDADPQYANLPLTDAEQAGIVGDYSFGTGATERFTVARGARWFTIERPAQPARNLFHQGGLVFNPAGAEAVRIRFELTPARRVTVSDGPLEVVARAI